MDLSLKEQLLLKISQTNDQDLLREISSLLEMQEQEGLYKLSEPQKTGIADARTQIATGQFLMNDEVNKQADEWLNE